MTAAPGSSSKGPVFAVVAPSVRGSLFFQSCRGVSHKCIRTEECRGRRGETQTKLLPRRESFLVVEEDDGLGGHMLSDVRESLGSCWSGPGKLPSHMPVLATTVLQGAPDQTDFMA